MAIQCQAYELGVALGAGARYRGRGTEPLSPAALVVPADWESAVVDGAIGDIPALAVEIAPAGAAGEKNVIDRYARAGAIELWMLRASGSAQPAFYQRSARGVLERIAADIHGDYFSALGESVVIPARWFAEQPSLWQMMRHWGMLTD